MNGFEDSAIDLIGWSLFGLTADGADTMPVICGHLCYLPFTFSALIEPNTLMKLTIGQT